MFDVVSPARRIVRRLPLALAIALGVLALLLLIGAVAGYSRPRRLSFEAFNVYGVWFDGSGIQFFLGRNYAFSERTSPDRVPSVKRIRWSDPLPSKNCMGDITVPSSDRLLSSRVSILTWPPLWDSGSVGWITVGYTEGGVSRQDRLGPWIDVRAAPAWLLIAVVAAYPLAYLGRWIGRRRPGDPSICRACGYDLRATPERCPECGTTSPVPSPGTPGEG